MRALCVAALVLAACSGPTVGLAPGDSGTPCVVIAEAGGGVVVVGERAQAVPRLRLQCFDGVAPRVDQVVVEVIDPDEHRISSFTVGPPAVGGGGTTRSVSADIAFTPDRAGPWTVIARFEPSVGRVQLSFEAVVVRTDAGFRLARIDAFPPGCTQFGVLASGAPVCLVGDVSPQLAIGAQRIDGDAFAIDGEAIWIVRREVTQLRIARFVSAEGFTHQTNLFIPTQSPKLIGHGGSAIVAGAFDDAGSRVRAVTQLWPEPDAGVTFVQRPIGERFALGLAAAGDRLIVPTVPFGGGAAQTVVLEPDGGFEVGAGAALVGQTSADEGFVWSDEETFSRPGATGHAILVVDHDGAQARHRTLRFSGAQMPQPRLSPQTPVGRFATNNAVLRLGEPDLGWEIYATGPGFGPVISATRRHAFARSDDGKTLKIIDR